MSTEFYADYIKKTTFDPDTSSVRQKFTAVKADDVEIEINVEEEEQLHEAATDTKKKPASKTPKVEVPATELPEELHGDQDKLDHNKDKKISASDMKKVRKHGPVDTEEGFLDAVKGAVSSAGNAVSGSIAARKAKFGTSGGAKSASSMRSVNQSTEYDNGDGIMEGTFKVEVEGLPTMYMDGSAGEIKASLRKKFKDPKAVISVERITPAEKKKELRAKVAEDQAAVDAFLKKGGEIKKYPPAHPRNSSDMEDEVKGRVDTRRFKTRGKVKSMGEEEQVDELKKSTLGSYIRTAAPDVGYQASKAANAIASNDHKDSNRKEIRDADRKRYNRVQGIQRASQKLQKAEEGAMKRIATQDAEKERLGPKVKGSGLDTFKKKPVGEEKDTHATKDGRTAKKGLWYNIHKKRERGEAPAKPGDPDRPSAADLKRSQ